MGRNILKTQRHPEDPLAYSSVFTEMATGQLLCLPLHSTCPTFFQTSNPPNFCIFSLSFLGSMGSAGFSCKGLEMRCFSLHAPCVLCHQHLALTLESATVAPAQPWTRRRSESMAGFQYKFVYGHWNLKFTYFSWVRKYCSFLISFQSVKHLKTFLAPRLNKNRWRAEFGLRAIVQ